LAAIAHLIFLTDLNIGEPSIKNPGQGIILAGFYLKATKSSTQFHLEKIKGSLGTTIAQ